MAKNANIETGVDRLLSIIRKHKKISHSEAAKLLGVSPTVAEEWGDFLEDEKFIKKEYKFTKTYFVIVEGEAGETTKKAEDFDRKKEGFIRKAEVTLAELDKDSEVINSLRGEFSQLKDDMAGELKGMQVELKQIEKYELLKGEMDKRIETQKKELDKRIKQVNEDVKKEQEKYDKLLNEIDIEKVKLEKEKEEEMSIRETEVSLKSKLGEVIGTLDKIKEQLKKEDSQIVHSDMHIKQLSGLAETIKSDVIQKKSLIDNLLVENKKIEEQIKIAQQHLLAKVSENQKLMDKAHAQSKTFGEDKIKKFFSKKSDIEKLIKDVVVEKDLLEKDLVELIKEAKSFKVAKKKEVAQKIKKIETKLQKTAERRQKYEEKMHKLSGVIGTPSSKKKKGWFSFKKK